MDLEEAKVTSSLGVVDNLQEPFEPPINRLPFEILIDILSLSMTHDLPLDDEVKFIPWDKACLAACHRWRDCILDSSQIWSTITLKDSTSVEEATTWLSRASSSPLRVSAYLNSTDNADRWQQVWQLVTSHPIRLYRLFIGSHFSFARRYPLFPNQMSNIEHLELKSQSDSDMVSALPPLFHHEQPKNLKSFVISGFFHPILFMDDLLSIDVSHLTTLKMESSDMRDEAWTVLCEACSLETLEWTILTLNPVTPPIDPLSFPNLRRLVLNGSMCDIFADLPLPSLRELSLDAWGCKSGSIPVFHQSPGVTRLRLRLVGNAGPISDDFTPLLSAFNRLEFLRINSWHHGRLWAILPLLAKPLPHYSDEEPTWLCPELRQVVCYGLEHDFSMSRPLVEARTRYGGAKHPLEVILSIHSRDMSIWEDWIRGLHFVPELPEF